MTRKRGSEDDPVAVAVLEYFRRNPECIDDLEGIARWRLHAERVDQVVHETERALAQLVNEGHLERIDTPGLRQRYRLAQAKTNSHKQPPSPSGRGRKGNP